MFLIFIYYKRRPKMSSSLVNVDVSAQRETEGDLSDENAHARTISNYYTYYQSNGANENEKLSTNVCSRNFHFFIDQY